jgi:hypothetical protein
MANFNKTLGTHSDRLERWLGADAVDRVSQSMKGWYGPPIALHGVPGTVYATRDGDFAGECRDGWEASALDRALDVVKRLQRGARVASGRQRHQLNAGFTGLSDLISEATAGAKRREFSFAKGGTTGVVGATNSLWRLGSFPVAGAAAAAAPGGTVPDDTTTGAFPFVNPTGGDTQHFVSGFPIANVSINTLLLYDRIFAVAKTMNSTATEAVTGVPTRYQNATSGTADSADGNFLFVECGTALAATAHNWTVCTYTDQNNNAGASLPSVTGNSGNIGNRLDHPLSASWFCPLTTGDIGVKALTQMQCSAAVATGTVDFVIGHAIAWMPCPIANIVCGVDGINTAFNLTRIFDDACLAFLEVAKSATNSTNYTGTFTTVAG